MVLGFWGLFGAQGVFKMLGVLGVLGVSGFGALGVLGFTDFRLLGWFAPLGVWACRDFKGVLGLGVDEF